jgi:hypothetical protein
MTLLLSTADRDLLHQYLDHVLERFKAGELSLLEARSGIAHAFIMTAQSDRGVSTYMKASLDEEARATPEANSQVGSL